MSWGHLILGLFSFYGILQYLKDFHWAPLAFISCFMMCAAKILTNLTRVTEIRECYSTFQCLNLLIPLACMNSEILHEMEFPFITSFLILFMCIIVYPIDDINIGNYIMMTFYFELFVCFIIALIRQSIWIIITFIVSYINFIIYDLIIEWNDERRLIRNELYAFGLSILLLCIHKSLKDEIKKLELQKLFKKFITKSQYTIIHIHN